MSPKSIRNHRKTSFRTVDRTVRTARIVGQTFAGRAEVNGVFWGSTDNQDRRVP